MTHDARSLALAPAIPRLLDPHGLVATYVEEDFDCDAAIEVRLAGTGPDDDLGDVQITTAGTYLANAWTDANRHSRAHGLERPTADAAIADLVGLLERHHRIAAQ